jgi:hypothetical protein
MKQRDRAMSQSLALSILSIRCVVKQPLLLAITMISASHWPPPTPVYSIETGTCRFGIGIILEAAMTDLSNVKASHCVVGSQ